MAYLVPAVGFSRPFRAATAGGFRRYGHASGTRPLDAGLEEDARSAVLPLLLAHRQSRNQRIGRFRDVDFDDRRDHSSPRRRFAGRRLQTGVRGAASDIDRCVAGAFCQAPVTLHLPLAT